MSPYWLYLQAMINGPIYDKVIQGKDSKGFSKMVFILTKPSPFQILNLNLHYISTNFNGMDFFCHLDGKSK